jgi:hypothetical protein
MINLALVLFWQEMGLVYAGAIVNCYEIDGRTIIFLCKN